MTDAPHDPEKTTMQFSYLKSSAFRVVHVDGALGSITPRGLFHMAVYSERLALPQVVEQDFNNEGEPIGRHRVKQTREGIVREIDVDLMFNRDTAERLRNWLNERMAQFDAIEVSTEEPDA